MLTPNYLLKKQTKKKNSLEAGLTVPATTNGMVWPHLPELGPGKQLALSPHGGAGETMR